MKKHIINYNIINNVFFNLHYEYYKILFDNIKCLTCPNNNLN